MKTSLTFYLPYMVIYRLQVSRSSPLNCPISAPFPLSWNQSKLVPTHSPHTRAPSTPSIWYDLMSCRFDPWPLQHDKLTFTLLEQEPITDHRTCVSQRASWTPWGGFKTSIHLKFGFYPYSSLLYSAVIYLDLTFSTLPPSPFNHEVFTWISINK